MTRLRPDIGSLSLDELQARLADWGVPAFRARQIMLWLYQHQATNWEAMTNLPKDLRHRLAEGYALGKLSLVAVRGSRDTTAKFLWRLCDGSFLESVLIPASEALYGEPSDRHTLCLSTQVGCAYGCRFCASGLAGWRRNLDVEEIVDQVLGVERWRHLTSGLLQPDVRERDGGVQSGGRAPSGGWTRTVNNLVIMGMGEPLANYDALLKALRILNADWGGGIGARKITVSTSGLAPQIRMLAEEREQFRLAISLHGATDEVRNRLMPVNRKYPLRELLEACEYYLRRKGRMLSLEYILIKDINDSCSQALDLARVAKRLEAKVNLIPYNPVDGLTWQRPGVEVQEAFRSALVGRGVQATLRREKGVDIDAACGQLRLRAEQEAAGSEAAASRKAVGLEALARAQEAVRAGSGDWAW